MTLARWKTFGIGIVLLAGVLAFWTPKEAAGSGQARFSPEQVSLEAEQEIVKLRFHGGHTRMLRIYSLMGDGRFSVSTQKNASSTPELAHSGKLSDAELSAVVEAVMRAQLYELDSEQLEALRNREKTPGPYISGAGGLEVEIRLSLFPGTAPDGNDELRSNFGVRGSDLGEGAYPNVAELSGIREIVAHLRRAESRAISNAEVKP